MAFTVEAAEFVVGQAAKAQGGVSMGADTKVNTLRVAAHLRSEICVSLRMAASAVAPSSPMWFALILHSTGEVGAVRG